MSGLRVHRREHVNIAKYFVSGCLAKSKQEMTQFVLEIASNDGTFLKRFQEAGLKVLGVDPAKNLANSAQNNGIPTRVEFFGSGIAQKIRNDYGPAQYCIRTQCFTSRSRSQ